MSAAVLLDNTNKFMPQQRCIDVIYEIYDDPSLRTNAEKNQCIKDYFIGKSVVTQYGYYRAYKIIDVRFDKTPITHRFSDRSGDTVNVMDYFKKKHKVIL